MKYLALIASLIIATTSQGQLVVKDVYSVRTMKLIPYTQADWQTENITYPKGMKIIMNIEEGVIYVRDNASSKYTLINKGVKNNLVPYYCYEYKAFDEKNIPVDIDIVQWEDGTKIMSVYYYNGTYCFNYFYN